MCGFDRFAIPPKNLIEMLGEPAVRLHSCGFGHDLMLRRHAAVSKLRGSIRDSAGSVLGINPHELEGAVPPIDIFPGGADQRRARYGLVGMLCYQIAQGAE